MPQLIINFVVWSVSMVIDHTPLEVIRFGCVSCHKSYLPFLLFHHLLVGENKCENPFGTKHWSIESIQCSGEVQFVVLNFCLFFVSLFGSKPFTIGTWPSSTYTCVSKHLGHLLFDILLSLELIRMFCSNFEFSLVLLEQ